MVVGQAQLTPTDFLCDYWGKFLGFRVNISYQPYKEIR